MFDPHASIGSSVTKIGLTETRLGIIPGAGGTQRLTRLLGISKAKSLIFTAKVLTAAEALDMGRSPHCVSYTVTDARLGVVDYVSAPEQTAVDRALELAKDISANGLYLSAAGHALYSPLL